MAKERPKGSASGAGEGAWSVAEVLEVVKANARGWRGDGLKLFAELRFTCAACGAPRCASLSFSWLGIVLLPVLHACLACPTHPPTQIRGGGASGGILRAILLEPRVRPQRHPLGRVVRRALPAGGRRRADPRRGAQRSLRTLRRAPWRGLGDGERVRRADGYAAAGPQVDDEMGVMLRSPRGSGAGSQQRGGGELTGVTVVDGSGRR